MKNIRKILAAVMALCAVFALSACGSGSGDGDAAQTADAGGDEASYKVGIVMMIENGAFLDMYDGVVSGLAEAGYVEGENLEIDYQNAQGDTSTINTICQQFVGNKVDAIVAIATPAAQGAATAVAGTDIPVIFSAVTDPAAAGLVENLEAPEGNITGTSDAIPVEKIFELAAELTPDAESFGLIYNTGEVNSVSVIDETKAYLDAQGISYTEASVASTGDVQTAAQTLLSKCDAIFAPIDNTVASAMGVLADEAIKAGKPVYVAADSMVNDGGLATVGVNYTNLGTQTADMLLKVLTGTPVCEVPVEVLKENAVVVNEETAAAIGVDVSKYAR